jgi:hypothetical protein
VDNQPPTNNPAAAAGDSEPYEPPEFLRFRAFVALKNLPLSEPFIADAFADCEVVLKLLDAALGAAYDSPPDHWFPNNIAAMALHTRAYSGLQASAHLCVLGFYAEARTMLRGVYEAAGLARTLAKRRDFAERWLHEGEWFKDNVARQFIQSGTDQRVAHSDMYKHMSEYAHPKAISTLRYLFTSEGEYRPSPYPEADRDSLEECARYITIVGLFVAWTFRNSAAHPATIPGWWHRELTEISEEITGMAHDHVDKDWEAHRERHEALMAGKVRHSDELEAELNADPNSTQNLLRRLAAKAAGVENASSE